MNSNRGRNEIELNHWEDVFIITNPKFFFFFLSSYDIMLRVSV